MTLDRLVGSTRRLIGSPSINTVPEREIMEHLIPSIQWLAGHLKFSITEDDHIDLVAEQREYPIPEAAIYFQWVQISGNLLEPASVWALNSGAATTQTTATSGQSWMSIPSGQPQRYAVSGRRLILYPPASADFITLNPLLSWRYVDCGAFFTQQSQEGLTPRGIPALSELDLDVVRFDAAKAWLSSHLLGQDQNALAAMQAQIAAFEKEIATRLPECKRRIMDMIEDYSPTMRPDTSQRYIAAR